MRLALTIPFCLLIACTQFPQLDDTVSMAAQNSDFPDLISLDGIVAQAGATSVTPQTIQGVNARVARLKSKAATLQRPIIDAPTRARMARGVARR